MPKVVIDTNVLVSGLKSRRGMSFKLLSRLGEEKFLPVISVPLVVEYEDVLKRRTMNFPLTDKDIDEVLNYFCSIAEHRRIHNLWRPFLKDPKDDMVLELAVESGSKLVITYNAKDFQGSEKFGVEIIRPGEFLKRIGEIE